VDGVDLRGPERASGESRKFAETFCKGRAAIGHMLHPSEQGFGAMKREHAAAARVGIKAVGEECFRARALVTERERSLPRRQPERNAGNILRGVFLSAGERDASGLGFGCADGFAVNELRVVRSPVAKESSQMA